MDIIKEKKERKLRKIIDETWKEIPGSNNQYMISNYGRIKSFCKDKNGKFLRFSEISGFYTINLRLNGVQKTLMVHKLTAEIHVPKTSDNCNSVCHLDWNTKNNYYKNLQWIPIEENYRRVSDHLRELYKNKPKRITYSKLKHKDVKHIKEMLQRGVMQRTIAKMFCVSEMQITRIKKGENWNDVSLENKN